MVVFRLIKTGLLRVSMVSVIAVSASGCMHFYEVKSYDVKNYVVLEGVTGSHGESIYKDEFDAQAKKVCRGSYSIIEQSHKPQVFECAHKVMDPNKYYWVVQCK
jgi:hypothetical protein